MGCGCKNKGQQAQAPQTPQEVQQAKLEAAKQVNEGVKQAIKKTIEKYYNQTKKG
jgi:hypothetical protein